MKTINDPYKMKMIKEYENELENRTLEINRS